MAESAYIACAENISLLHLMHKIPEPPSANTRPPPTSSSSSYELPFAMERSLAGALAFLSSITDSPNCITGVCVEEQSDTGKLQVHVAINKQKPQDNNATLNAICGGFNQIFERLSRPGHGNCENDIFTKIVSLCRIRLLCRLGYEKKSAFKSTRNPLDKVLERARQSLTQLREGVEVPKMERYRKNSRSMAVQISQFLAKVSDLLKVISSWVQYQTDSELCAVIDGLCDFVATDQWRAVVDLIPDRLMDPSSRISLITMLRKGARYRHIARTLHRAAKKFPIVRRMEAVPVHLAESAFQRPSLPISPASLDGTFKRVVPNQKRNADRICQALTTTASDAGATFLAQTHKTLTEGKFHAEVQLLGHILTHPSPSPPRIVWASKDACFLCNCLLQAHAQLHTPRCHGKLYPGWRLPPTAEFRSLQASLNRLLEQKMTRSAAAMLKNEAQRRRRVTYPDPCESTCSTTVLSVTTVAAGDGAADAAGGGDMPVERDSDTTVVENVLISSDLTLSHKGTVSMARNSAVPIVEDILVPTEASSHQLRNMVSTKDVPTPPDTSFSSSMVSTIREEETQRAAQSSRNASSSDEEDEWTLRQSYALAQGEVVTASLPADKTSRMYTAGPLQVQLEYTKTERRRTSKEKTPHLHYRIQQLTSREAHTVRESAYIPIIDVSSIKVAEERTCKLHELADLHLSAGDCIFRLVLQPAIQP